MIEWSKVVGWILSVLLGLMFLAAGTAKLLLGAQMKEQMPPGIHDWLLIIALGEIASAILFLVPATSTFGTLLLSSFMGGAIIVHMLKPEPFVPQAVILVLIWLAGYLRGTWTLGRSQT